MEESEERQGEPDLWCTGKSSSIDSNEFIKQFAAVVTVILDVFLA